MRRFLNNRIGILVLVFAVVTLVTGVTWAATGTTPGSSTNQQLSSSVVEIVPIDLKVEPGAALEVAGAGFTPGQTVLFSVLLGDLPELILQGGQANSAGAFLASVGSLPVDLAPGIYSIAAFTVDGHVASSPLIVVESK